MTSEIMYKAVEAVEAKVNQNSDVKERLLKTNDKKIIENSKEDWGCGEDNKGKNQSGKIVNFNIILCFLYTEWNNKNQKFKGRIDYWNKYIRKEIESDKINNHSFERCSYKYGVRSYNDCVVCDIKESWYEDVEEIKEIFMKWKNTKILDITEIIAILFATSDYWDNKIYLNDNCVLIRFEQWENIIDKQIYIKEAREFINYYIHSE